MSIDDYIGIPFSEMDCWQFVSHFYRTYLHKEIPEYRIDPLASADIHATIEKEIRTPRWELLDEPEQFCIVLMRLNSRFVNHAGIYLGNGRILHSYSKTGSCVAYGPLWDRATAYYMKPKEAI